MMPTNPLTPPPALPFENWKPRFFSIWAGQAVSLLGTAIVQFGLIWYLTQLTDSATTLATASLMGFLPQIFLAPLIGTLADRWNRRWIMIGSDAFVALATTGLAVLFALDMAQVWHIYLLMFLRSVGSGFHQSAVDASTVLLVPQEHLSRVQGLNQTLNGSLNILSAPLGAFVLSILPMQGILAIDVVTAMIAILILLFVTIPQPERPADSTHRLTVWQEMRAGFSYVRNWPALLMILAMFATINFFLGPTGSLLPLLVTRHFQGGAAQFGWLQAASSVGIILGGVLLGAGAGIRQQMITAMGGLVGIGVGVFATGIAPANAYGFALGAVVLTGTMASLTNGSIVAIQQASISPEMQGRVFAFIRGISRAAVPIGLVIAGPVADAIGIRTWFLIGGVICAAMGVFGFFNPTVMNFRARIREKQDSPAL